MNANFDTTIALNAFNNARFNSINAAKTNEKLSIMAKNANETMPSQTNAKLLANSEFGDILVNKISQNEKQIQNFKAQNGTKIASNNTNNASSIDKKALKEQTDAFEAFFIKTILDIAISTENPLFGKDAGDQIYNSMYNDTMSQALSGGFGFSNLLYDFLLQRAK